MREKTMTPHGRFMSCMHFEAVDHVPLWEWGPWPSTIRRWRNEAPVLILQGPRSPSLFSFVRELLGPERTLYAFYDEPDSVHVTDEGNKVSAEYLAPMIADLIGESDTAEKK